MGVHTNKTYTVYVNFGKGFKEVTENDDYLRGFSIRDEAYFYNVAMRVVFEPKRFTGIKEWYQTSHEMCIIFLDGPVEVMLTLYNYTDPFEMEKFSDVVWTDPNKVFLFRESAFQDGEFVFSKFH